MIPKYNGKQDVLLHQRRLDEVPLAARCQGFGNTTPIDAFKAGDFSALLTGKQIGVDALGRPLFEGQIFNPATTRARQRRSRARSLSRQHHPGERSAAQRSRRADRAVDGAPGSARHPNNVAGNPAGDQTWELDARNIMFRIDHSFTPKFRASFSFYWNHRPVDPQLRRGRRLHRRSSILRPSRRRTPTTTGTGSPSASRPHHAHQQFDWIISNNLMNHSTVAYDRWFMGGNSPLGRRELAAAAVGGPARRAAVSRDTTAGPPSSTSPATSPTTPSARTLAVVRVPGEQPLAVLQRPDVGQGPAHPEDGLRVPAPRFPVPRLGCRGGRPAISTSIGWAPAVTTPAATTSDRPAIRSRRSCSARFRRQPDDPGTADVPRDVLGHLGERRVQGLRQADPDPRDALRLPVGPHRDDRISTRRSTRTHPTREPATFRGR